MADKRIKRKALSIADKINILKKVDENPHLTRIQIAKEHNLPVSTLNTIVAKRDTFTHLSLSSKAKKIRKGKYDQVEEKLLIWFKQARNANIPINGTILREKAEEIAKTLGVEFIPSNGWIDRFKKRGGLIYKTITGESKSVDVGEVAAWKSNVLPELISAYKPKDIFNADECALFYNLLPDKTFTYKEVSCHGVKQSKERLTVLVAANMDGSEKLPLLVIGKSKKPRCFKNIKTFPCDYKSNKTAWMTLKIFEEYLIALDKKMNKEKRHIILFVDNCSAHSKDMHYENVKVVFFPALSTSVLQPMDQGVIKVLKQFFRKRLVYLLLQNLDSGLSNAKINILDAMNYIVAAWEMVKPTVITNCFRKAGFNEEEVNSLNNGEIAPLDSEINKDDWQILQKGLNFTSTFDEYVDVDNEVLTCEMLSIEDICHQEEISDVEEEEEEIYTPTCGEARNSLETLRHFVQSHENAPESIMKSLRELDSYLLTVSMKNKKQRKIDQYFVTS